MIRELVDLLTCQELDQDELDQVTANIANAPGNAEFAWASTPAQAIAVSMQYQLGEFIATADQMGDLHAQLQTFFDDPLADLPAALAGGLARFPAYADWMREQLSGRCGEEGGCVLLSMDAGVNDSVSVFVVYAPLVPRILELAAALALKLESAAAK